MPTFTPRTIPKTVRYFLEPLSEEVDLKMMEIPAGEFEMGSPDKAEGRDDDEGPVHRVQVPQFWLGKYPVTQAQWRIVAGWDPIKHDLDPDPVRFKGLNRPVEQVSWHDAVEFCARLAQRTGRGYRLPSEAEWEYACRAGTTTPFYFGETITTEVANYRGIDNESFRWKGSYGRGPTGEYRKETTPVGYFEGTNDFGLSDMHGNVWEWCADPWHSSYKGAPTDGSVWEKGGDSSEYILRGGSWYYGLRYCRSANRRRNDPHGRHSNYGFRIACSH